SASRRAISRWPRSSSASSSSRERRLKAKGSGLARTFRGVQDARDGSAQLLPARALRGELLTAGSREPIDLHPLLVVGDLPRGVDPALPLEPMERRIHRARVDL